MSGDGDAPQSGDPAGAPSEQYAVEVDGQRFDVRVVREPEHETEARPRRPRSRRGFSVAKPGPILAPIPGNVLQVHVADGDAVVAGQVVCVIEAMKMENEIAAPASGTVVALSIEPGDLVAGGQELMRIEAAPHGPAHVA